MMSVVLHLPTAPLRGSPPGFPSNPQYNTRVFVPSHDFELLPEDQKTAIGSAMAQQHGTISPPRVTTPAPPPGKPSAPFRRSPPGFGSPRVTLSNSNSTSPEPDSQWTVVPAFYPPKMAVFLVCIGPKFVVFWGKHARIKKTIAHMYTKYTPKKCIPRRQRFFDSSILSP